MRNHTPYTEEQWQEMIAAYQAGASMREAGRIHGAKSNSMTWQFKKRGIAARAGSDPHYRATISDKLFATVEDEASAYWLGFLYADGCMSQDCMRITLSLSAADFDHVVKFSEFLGLSRRPRIVTGAAGYAPGKSKFAILKVGSVDVCRNLLRLGLGPGKTWRLAPWVGPSELMRHFWRGCLDGDGSLFYSKARRGGRDARVSFVGTEEMVRGLSEFVAGHTGKPGHVHSHAAEGAESKSAGRRTYFADWGGNVSCKGIVALFYGGVTVSLDRKQKIADEMMAYERAPRPICERKVAELRELIDRYGTLHEAAKHTGTHKVVLYQRAKRLGVELRPRKPTHCYNG